MITADTIWQKAVYTLDKHKATDLRVLRVADITAITDYFVIAGGGSATQLRSLSDYLERELGPEGITPLRSDGYQTGDWITLDYGDVIVHLFRAEVREFYDLERLWTDAQVVDITPYLVQENEQ